MPLTPSRARSLTLQTAQKARKAKRELFVLVPLLAATVYAYVRREELFGLDAPVRVGAAIVMVVLGWALARDLGRFTAPALFRRMDPATAGTVGFLIRLVFIGAAALFALRVAALKPATLAVGGAITAVVFGLAAQQTLGNLIAGMVLISARPFKVGDRARLRPDVRPSDLQALLEEGVTTPVRTDPSISLEEIDRDEVIVRIAATPLQESDGPQLADEVLAAIGAVTRPDEDGSEPAIERVPDDDGPRQRYEG